MKVDHWMIWYEILRAFSSAFYFADSSQSLAVVISVLNVGLPGPRSVSTSPEACLKLQPEYRVGMTPELLKMIENLRLAMVGGQKMEMPEIVSWLEKEYGTRANFPRQFDDRFRRAIRGFELAGRES